MKKEAVRLQIRMMHSMHQKIKEAMNWIGDIDYELIHVERNLFYVLGCSGGCRRKRYHVIRHENEVSQSIS